MSRAIALSACVAMLLCTGAHAAQPSAPPERPWLDTSLSSEARARAALAAMTLDEKLRLVFGYSDQAFTELAKVPDDIVPPDLKTYVVTHQVKGSAGFVPGVLRLGIPDQTQTDASMGVRNSLIPSTALPSGLSVLALISCGRGPPNFGSPTEVKLPSSVAAVSCTVRAGSASPGSQASSDWLSNCSSSEPSACPFVPKATMRCVAMLVAEPVCAGCGR